MSQKKKSVLGDASQSLGPRASGLADRSVGETPDQALQPAIAPSHKAAPGPWTAHHGWASDVDGRTVLKYPDHCEVIGGSYDDGTHFSMSGHVGIVNARVMAAAPELLEQLKNLVGLARTGAATLDKYAAALTDAETVIAKAEQP